MNPSSSIAPRRASGRLLDLVTRLLLLWAIAVAAAWYPRLPSRIPSHFGADGEPDAWSGKWMILLLPGISAALYIVLTVVSRYPHRFNYPVRITDGNRAVQERLAQSLLRWLKAEIVLIFYYIEWTTIKVAVGSAKGLGEWFLPAFVATVFGTIAIYLYQAYRNR